MLYTGMLYTGTPGDDTFAGTSDNDTLSGGSGHDRLDGNDGDDLIRGDGGNDTLSGGAGRDTVSYASAGGSVIVSLAIVAAQNTYGGGTDVLSGFEDVIGSSYSDILSGDAGGNWLDGGAGKDTLVGGLGDDSYVVDNAGDVVQESGNGGVDVVFAALSWALGANIEYLTLTGSGHINATGNGLNNLLTGNAGNNVLNGGIGHDLMAGGLGDDTYYVDSTGDNVVEAHHAGNDIIFSSVSYSLFGRAVESLTLTGTGQLTATGNSLSNTLTGNTGNNLLDGGGGADTLAGGSGNDTYFVNTMGDVVVEITGGGSDLVVASASYALTDIARVEALTLGGTGHIDATGNGQANSLNGNDGNNRIDGGGGKDTMTGGLGDDTYVVNSVGDVVIEGVGGGYDSIILQSLDSNVYSLAETSKVEAVTIIGRGWINLGGNSLDNTLTGNTQQNKLWGMDGNDSLVGLGGDDTLIGYAGNDTMLGGDGNDHYHLDSAGDVAVELAGEGWDTIYVNFDFSLVGTNIENVGASTSYGDYNLTGNEVSNILTGNYGHNLLDGGAGADHMRGLDGNDTYIVDHANEDCDETESSGIDLVISSVDFDLGYGYDNPLDNLTLTGSAVKATGNDLYNVLTGTSGNNLLTGVGGNDSLIGGEGNDTYVISGHDVVVEMDNGGTDEIRAEMSYVLTDATIENLSLLDRAAALDATGNTNNNVLTGNSYANQLRGGQGLDTLIGGGGNDSLVGGAGDDWLVGGDGHDTLYGGQDSDWYLFAVNSGEDVIDSVEGHTFHDRIDISAYTGGVANEGMLTQVGDNTIIDLGGGNSITVTGTSVENTLLCMVW
ncbi:hypothetical protein ABAC460_13550 [Asticcacaulis sp. AC460]|uniref:beta strand repeat-containing protein n=1 Tax=Asticcacaulis sp. AC460 TaxID=1282360 RepID=UPI0003C3D3C1|nr:calcium-binding protein [Asticcacaulis sp. AC460]ESQ89089.1 hypothetical protein ABAC460_13550 [Asticcacaulis sp. AC460]